MSSPVEPATFPTLRDVERLRECCPAVRYSFVEEHGNFAVLVQPGPEALAGMSPEEVQALWSETGEPWLSVTATTPDYFGFNGLRAEQGRLITADDVKESGGVIVLGAEVARRLFPDGDALGRPVNLLQAAGRSTMFETFTVAGVLAPAEPGPESHWSPVPPLLPRHEALDQGAVVPLSTLYRHVKLALAAGSWDLQQVLSASGLSPSEERRSWDDLPVAWIRVAPAERAGVREAQRQVTAFTEETYGNAVAAYAPLERFEQERWHFFKRALGTAVPALAALLLAARVLWRLTPARAATLGFAGIILGFALAPAAGSVLASGLREELPVFFEA